jgi:hypothetical protein
VREESGSRHPADEGPYSLVRLVLATLLLVTILLGGALPAAFAQSAPDNTSSTPTDTSSSDSGGSDTVHMDVRAGFDGVGRVGGWLPLDVDLTNQGDEVEANVQVVVSGGTGRSTYMPVPTTFSLPVVLPRMSHKRFTMSVNLPNTNNKFTARLVSTADSSLITEQDIQLTRVPLGDFFCGVLARDPSSYDFLAGLDLPPPIRRVRTAPLDPTTLPESADLLGGFDCLIIDNATTNRLRQEQLDALSVWVGGGGLLITVGGASWQSTLGPLPPELVPVEATQLTQVASLSALGDLTQTPLDSGGPWLISQGRPRTDQGAQVAVSQQGIPLIVGEKRGDGTLIYLAFEPTAQDLRNWTGNDQLWKYLITQSPIDNGVGSTLVRDYNRWGQRPPRLALADFSTQPKPTLDWLWELGAVYVVGLGGIVLFLGRRGMVGWSIASALTLTIVTTLVGAGIAMQRAEPDLAVNRLTIVRPIDNGDSPAAYTHQFVSLLARHDGNFTLDLDPQDLARGMFYPFPRPADESDANWPFTMAEGPQPTLDQLNLKQGQLATFQIDGQMRQAPSIQSDVRIENGSLTGTITNKTGGRLSDAYLFVDDDFRSLGTLERDQQRQIDYVLPMRAAAGDLAATAIAEKLTPAGSAGQPGSAARRDFLESLFSARFLFSRMDMRGPTLVGWLDTSPTQLLAPSFRISSSDLALLVQPLTAELPVGFEGEVPGAAMSRRDLGIGSGAPSDHEYYTVAPGEAITLSFLMPPAEGRFDLQELRLNIEGVVAGRTRSQQVPFTVSLFSWQDAEWQAWEVNPGSSIVPDGAKYVSAAGEIRVRYQLDSSLSQTVREARLTRLDVTPVGTVR